MKEKNLPGIVMELKAQKNADFDDLKELAKEALEQILSKKYDAEMRKIGVEQVLYYGIAFSGKNVEILEYE